MGQRLELQSLLQTLAPKVYFQPPAGMEMEYPCIVYHRDAARTEFADDNPYRYTTRYKVTIIDRDPDSVIPGKVARLPMCLYNAYFAVDGLNHDVYSLYF